MSGTIIAVLVLLVGLVILGSGLFYCFKEKEDKSARKVYLVFSVVGAVLAVGAVLKLVLFR